MYTIKKGENMTTSRITGFYNMTLEDRHAKLTDAADLTPESLLPFTTGGLSPESADHMIENVIGLYSLPLGIALNFQVNGRDVLVPMTLEEPSVVAGASFMAKLARAGGGYTATTTDPLMIGQMQVINVTNLYEAKLKVIRAQSRIPRRSGHDRPHPQEIRRRRTGLGSSHHRGLPHRRLSRRSSYL